MLLKHHSTQNLVEILELHDLWNPCCPSVSGRFHAGEEVQDADNFNKAELVFPSGEALPLCWLDPHYRQHQSAATQPTAILTR